MSFSSCFTSSNICKGCRDAVGGIKAAYVVAGCVTGTTENADQEILTVGATGGTVYQFQVEKNTSNFVETIQASLENGTVVVNQIVNLVFLKLQQSTRNQIKLLAQNTNLKVFVETNEGDIFYLGEDFGLALQTSTAETGTAFADRYGYTVVLEGFEKYMAKKLAGSLSNTLVGLSLSSCPC
jgi:iron only hydrogenase large subunit-like protein